MEHSSTLTVTVPSLDEIPSEAFHNTQMYLFVVYFYQQMGAMHCSCCLYIASLLFFQFFYCFKLFASFVLFRCKNRVKGEKLIIVGYKYEMVKKKLIENKSETLVTDFQSAPHLRQN